MTDEERLEDKIKYYKLNLVEDFDDAIQELESWKKAIMEKKDDIMNKKVVTIWHDIGLIIPMKTGVWFANQVNGVCCGQKEQEGIFIPLSYFSHHNIRDIERDYPDEKFIKDWIQKHELPLQLIENKWTEAWIPVKILKNDSELLKDFAGTEAILTYENSD